MIEKGKIKQAEMVKNIIPLGVECVFIRQAQQLGLGHAVLCAERVIGDEPFAVLLADDFIAGNKTGVTLDLLESFKLSGKSQLSVMEVSDHEISKYGVVKPGSEQASVAGLIEKPY